MHLPALVAAAGEVRHGAGRRDRRGDRAASVMPPTPSSRRCWRRRTTTSGSVCSGRRASIRTNRSRPPCSCRRCNRARVSARAVVWHLFHSIDEGDQVAEEAARGRGAETWRGERGGRGPHLGRLRPRDAGARAWRGAHESGLGRCDCARRERHPRQGGFRRGRSVSDARRAESPRAARGFSQPELARRGGRKAKRRKRDGLSRTQVMRTIPVFAKGLLADLFEVTGCRPPNESYFAVGDVTYRPEGGAQRISLVQTTLSKPCEAFVGILMKLTIALAERPITPEFADRIVLLFNRQYLACADDPFPPKQPKVGPNSTIVPSRRTRQGNFVYPPNHGARPDRRHRAARRSHQLHGMRGQRGDHPQRQPGARPRRDPRRLHRRSTRRPWSTVSPSRRT